MNSKQAKQIPIEHFLNKLNHKPVKSSGDDLWYKSPLHEDNTPSFKVNKILNSWYDFGLGEGGSIIDLVCTMYNDDVSHALKRLSSDYISHSPVKHYETIRVNSAPKLNTQSKLELKEVGKISEKALYCLLRDRCIDVDIAKKYLQQIYYSVNNNEKHNYALALKNDVGGYEFKNALMKGCIGSKAITSINLENGKDVAVFEGMMDFLAYLTHHKITDFQSSAIILNSTSMKDEGLKALNSKQFKKAFFFLDNDEMGNHCFEYLSQNSDCDFVDCSSIYDSFNDYNDFLIE
jgi:hypothetical protein